MSGYIFSKKIKNTDDTDAMDLHGFVLIFMKTQWKNRSICQPIAD